MKNTIITKGMHCKSCEIIIGESLMDLNGVKHVKADHQTGKVDIDYDQNLVSINTLKQIIKKEGYVVP